MSFLCHPPPALSFGAPDMRHQLAIGRLPVPVKHRATGRRRGLSEVTNRGMSLGRTLIDLADVARAATFGAVDTVLVDVDTVVPGTIDEDSGTVTFAPESATSYGVGWTRSTALCGSTAPGPGRRRGQRPREAGPGGHPPLHDIASDPHVETRDGLPVDPSVGFTTRSRAWRNAPIGCGSSALPSPLAGRAR
jgi:hypothetical protein